MIYLYLKTHNISGQKYLGQTKHDPLKYNGSGVIWKKHLKKYGLDITTEILAECETQEELRTLGMYYSDKWDIINDTKFANLQEESGQGATPNKPLSEEHKKAISQGLMNSKKKPGHGGLKGKDNPMYGRCRKGHGNQKIIYNDVIYNSCRELAKSLNRHPSYISRMIKRGQVSKINFN